MNEKKLSRPLISLIVSIALIIVGIAGSFIWGSDCRHRRLRAAVAGHRFAVGLHLLSVSKAYRDPRGFGWTAPRGGGPDRVSRPIDCGAGLLEWKPGFPLPVGHRLDRRRPVRALSFRPAKMEAQSDLCHGGGRYCRARRVLLSIVSVTGQRSTGGGTGWESSHSAAGRFG